MKTLLLTLFSCLFYINSLAQVSEFKTLFLPEGSMTVSDNIHRLTDSTFVLSGRVNEFTFVSLLNEEYEEIWSKKIINEITSANECSNTHINSLRILSDSTFQLIVNFGTGSVDSGFGLLVFDNNGNIIESETFILEEFRQASFPASENESIAFIIEQQLSSIIATQDSSGTYIFTRYIDETGSLKIDNVISINDSTDYHLGNNNGQAFLMKIENGSIIWANTYPTNSYGFGMPKDLLFQDSSLYFLLTVRFDNYLVHAEIDAQTGAIVEYKTLTNEENYLIQNANTQYLKKEGSIFYIQNERRVIQLQNEFYQSLDNYIAITDIQFINDTSYHVIGKLGFLPVKTTYYNPSDIGIAKFGSLESSFNDDNHDCANVYKEYYPEEVFFETEPIISVTFQEETLETDSIEYITEDISFSTRGGCVSAPNNIQATNFLDVDMYPNPTTGQFTLQSNNEMITSIEIYNHVGGLIKNPNFQPANEIALNLSDYPSGLYFIKIQTVNSKATKKLNLTH